MLLSEFDYELPPHLIAQSPLERRDQSRLLVMDNNGRMYDKRFADIVEYLQEGDCLVLNDTKVIPARLLGQKGDVAVEFLLLKRLDSECWEVAVYPGRRLRVGARVCFDDTLSADIVEVLANGNRIVRFLYDGIFEQVLERLGEMPLPHYITERLAEKGRYQTVYAANSGSCAAPTAGLHFTTALLERIRDKGVGLVFGTLHVGLGTFRPVKVENIDQHVMHSEYFEFTQEACDTVNAVRLAGGNVIAVGTTSVRMLEFCARNGELEPFFGETDIFIRPGYRFKVVDKLITNFHLPKSTLLMLVSAFSGREQIFTAYRHAIEQGYRFYSFGDAMMLELEKGQL